MEEEKDQQKAPRRVELTERDLSVLRWTGEQYATRLDQAQRLLGQQAGVGAQTPGMLSESATRAWLTRMKAIGAIEMDKPYRAQPPYFWLTIAGLRLINLDFKALRPATNTLNHLYWCGQARLYMAVERPSYVWISERRLRSEHAQATRGHHKAPELPDAHLQTDVGVIAIEVELTDKQNARLVSLIRRRVTEYYTVFYFCSRETQSHVEAVKKELAIDVRERLQVLSLSRLG